MLIIHTQIVFMYIIIKTFLNIYLQASFSSIFEDFLYLHTIWRSLYWTSDKHHEYKGRRRS